MIVSWANAFQLNSGFADFCTGTSAAMVSTNISISDSSERERKIFLRSPEIMA